jgi:AraC family transcriptional regulator
VGETLVRLRIEAARHGLRQAGGNVTRVALDTGFSTPQAFARAFRRETGTTPSAFARGAAAASPTLPEAQVRIVVRQPTEVVALRRIGADYIAMNEAYGQLWAWAEQAGVIDRLEGLYGLALDDAATVEPGSARYDACLALGGVDAPDPFVRERIAGGRYACLTLQGSYDGLRGAEQALMSWLVASEHDPTDAPLVHHFLNDPDSTPESEWLTDVMLPLASPS